MLPAIVIRGHYSGQSFIPSEAMPQVEGTAELIVIPNPAPPPQRGSIFDLFGKAERLRSAEDIEQQISEERQAWDER